MDSLEIDGRAVRRLRQSLRIPIAELAERVGISRPYLTEIECGRKPRVSFKTLDALERELGITDRTVLPKGRKAAPTRIRRTA